MLLTFLFGLVVNLPDAYYYPNYFYTRFGLPPEKLTLLLAILFLLFTVPRITSRSITIYLLILVSYVGTVTNSATALGRIVKISANHTDFARARLSEKYGDKIKYIDFLRHQIPAHSTVLIPPGIPPWRHTGDFYLMQAWLYPRQIFPASHYKVINVDTIRKFDYILISSEAYNNTSLTWPNFNIPTEKIIIYDWASDSGVFYDTYEFDFLDWVDKEPWGLLVPKSL